jgi:hypothetical protein
VVREVNVFSLGCTHLFCRWHSHSLWHHTYISRYTIASIWVFYSGSSVSGYTCKYSLLKMVEIRLLVNLLLLLSDWIKVDVTSCVFTAHTLANTDLYFFLPSVREWLTDNCVLERQYYYIYTLVTQYSHFLKTQCNAKMHKSETLLHTPCSKRGVNLSWCLLGCDTVM